MNYNTETIGRRTRVLIIAMLTVLMMLGCVGGASAASLNKKSLTGYVSGTYQLKVKGTSKKATWSTSNKKIASVSAKGLVTAKKTGKATITAKVNGKSYDCKVTVLAKPKISATKKTIVVGNKFTLTLKKSNGAKVKATKFKSSKQAVATVTSKGVVAGRKPGTCKIYTYLGSIKYTTTVTVNKKGASSNAGTAANTGNDGSSTGNVNTGSGNGLITKIEVGPTYSDSDLSSMKPGEYIRLEVKNVVPYSIENKKKITWASNDETVATVSSTGLVTAVAPGTTKIIARASDGSGVKDTVTVTVVKSSGNGTSSVTSSTSGGTSSGTGSNTASSGTSGSSENRALSAWIQLDGEESKSYTLNQVGDIVRIDGLYVQVSYTSGEVKRGYNELLDFKSSNTGVATVSSDGTITAKGSGTTEITASVKDYPSEYIKIPVSVIGNKYSYVVDASMVGYKQLSPFLIQTEAPIEKISVSTNGVFIRESNVFELRDSDGKRYICYPCYATIKNATITVNAEGFTCVKKITANSNIIDEVDLFFSWKEDVEKQLWRSNMSSIEKLQVVTCFIRDNFSYANYPFYGLANPNIAKTDCYGGAVALSYFADDLGIKCGVGHITDFGLAADGTEHKLFWAEIDGVEYLSDAQPQGGGFTMVHIEKCSGHFNPAFSSDLYVPVDSWKLI